LAKESGLGHVINDKCSARESDRKTENNDVRAALNGAVPGSTPYRRSVVP